MTTNNVSNISSIQPDFSNIAEINQDLSCLSSTPMYQQPPPTVTHPTPPPIPIGPPPSKPVIQTQKTSQNVSTSPDDIPPETADTYDYMIWSKVNLVIGALILGIPCIILSIITRRYKRRGNVRASKIMSRVTLGSNIFISFLYMCGVVGLVTYYNDMR